MGPPTIISFQNFKKKEEKKVVESCHVVPIIPNCKAELAEFL
jgi:hypothetical protein